MKKKSLIFFILSILFTIPTSVAYADIYRWTAVGPLATWKATACSTDCSVMAAAEGGGYIWVSNDMGATWTSRANAGSRSWTALAMSADGQIIYAAATSNNIFKSTDNGQNWTSLTNAGIANWKSLATSSDGSVVLAGQATTSGIVTASTDGGTTWTQQNGVGTANIWRSVQLSNNGNFAIVSNSTGGVWRGSGTPGSWSWTNVVTGKTSNDGLLALGAQSYVGAAIDSTGSRMAIAATDLLVSNDTGTTWIRKSFGAYSFSAMSATPDLKTIVIVNSSNCGASCKPIKATTPDYGTYTVGTTFTAVWPGFSAITIAQDGSRAISATNASYLYQSGPMPINSTASLALSSAPTFRVATTITATLTPSTGGRATFYSNGKRIAGCVNIEVSSGSTTCTWKPTNRGSAALTIKFVPTDSMATTVNGALYNTVVKNRLTRR